MSMTGANAETVTGCRIVEGGGAHYGDDLWTCLTCGHQKYPEVFRCPRGATLPLVLDNERAPDAN